MRRREIQDGRIPDRCSLAACPIHAQGGPSRIWLTPPPGLGLLPSANRQPYAHRGASRTRVSVLRLFPARGMKGSQPPAPAKHQAGACAGLPRPPGRPPRWCPLVAGPPHTLPCPWAGSHSLGAGRQGPAGMHSLPLPAWNLSSTSGLGREQSESPGSLPATPEGRGAGAGPRPPCPGETR